jgi:hypothetical protein
MAAASGRFRANNIAVEAGDARTKESAMSQKLGGGKGSKGETNGKNVMHANESKETGFAKKEPSFFTPRHVRIPHLREKVELLYRYHPTIRLQRELAAEMKVSPAALAGYINGIPSADGIRVNPGTMPAKHFSTFVNIFGVPAAVLEMEDLAEFKNALETFESGRGAWDKLIRALPDDEAIEIIVNEDRRIVDRDEEGDHEGILHVLSGDEVLLRVRNPGFDHGVLLQQDRQGWWTLRPSSRWKETEVDEALVFPRQPPDGPPRFAQIEGSGVHLVLGMFMQEPLPTATVNALMADPIDIDSLNRTASFFNNQIIAGKSKLLSRRFLVVNAPRGRSHTRGTPKSGGPAAN